MNHKTTLLVGEPMGLFIAEETGRLEDVDHFSFTTCGAELNVAIGMKRLGHEVSYMTKLGRDPFGKRITNRMEEIGISTGHILFSDERPTGFMFKSMVAEGDPSIFYFRRGSAASTLSAEDVAALDLSGCALVHMTGITPALSDSAREAVLALAARTRGSGVKLSFDPNLRLQLWPDTEKMAECLNGIAEQADIFLPGVKEAKILMGEDDPEKIAAWYIARGTKTVVVKLGAKGAYYASASGESGYVPGFHVDRIVDTVGAGDGFAAGVLTALLEDMPLAEAVRRGCAIGAIQLLSKGDNDGALPTRRSSSASWQANRNGGTNERYLRTFRTSRRCAGRRAGRCRPGRTAGQSAS